MPVYLDTAFRPFYGCGHRRVVLVSVAIGSLSRHVTKRERGMLRSDGAEDLASSGWPHNIGETARIE